MLKPGENKRLSIIEASVVASDGALAIACQRCGAQIGEPCNDVRDGEEAFGCIAHCHDGQCAIVYDSRGSGLWVRSQTWENYRQITLETAVKTYPHLWERYAGTYGDRYRTWYRGRWLGIFQRFSFSRWPCPFEREPTQLSLFN